MSGRDLAPATTAVLWSAMTPLHILLVIILIILLVIILL